MKHAPSPSRAKESDVRTLTTLIVTAGAIVALAAPAVATARVLPVKHPVKLAVRVVKKQSHTVRCICIQPAGTVAVASQQQLEAQYDLDLLDHGLAPVYGTPA